MNIKIDLTSSQQIFRASGLSLTGVINKELQFGSIGSTKPATALPALIELILSRFEVLLESRVIQPEKALRSYYDLDHPRLFSPWTQLDEVQLQATKEFINKDVFNVNQVAEPRVLSQILLDYLEEVIKGPVISESTQLHLSNLIEQSKSEELPDIVTYSTSTRIPRSEYALLMRLRQFFLPFACKNVLETEVNHTLAR